MLLKNGNLSHLYHSYDVKQAGLLKLTIKKNSGIKMKLVNNDGGVFHTKGVTQSKKHSYHLQPVIFFFFSFS